MVSRTANDYIKTQDGKFALRDHVLATAKVANTALLTDTVNEIKVETGPFVNRDEYIKAVLKWLYFEDLQVLDVVMATAISIALPGDPLWLFLIAPPGSTKTELLRCFANERIFSLSTFTPQTLISGLQGKKTKDLLPLLNGKLLIIKDFTSILSKETEDQTAILADLRECYDGYLEKSYGSGIGTVSYHSKFGLIAGVTQVIDMYRKVHSLLGERFLKCRISINADPAIERALELAGQENEMREELQHYTNSCFITYINKIQDNPPIVVTKDIYQKVRYLADITAKLRSEVPRDHRHIVQYSPSPEVGTRLSKQLLKLAQALSILYDHDAVGESEYNVLQRIAGDTIPDQRKKLMMAMTGQDYLSSKAIGERANIPTSTTTELLEDIWILKLIDRRGDSEFKWQLKTETQNLWLNAGLE